MQEIDSRVFDERMNEKCYVERRAMELGMDIMAQAQHECGWLDGVDAASARTANGFDERRPDWRLGCFAVAMLQQPAKSLAAADRGEREIVVGRGFLRFSLGADEQLIVEPLVRPLLVVMLNRLRHEVVEMPLAEYKKVIEHFLLDRLNKTLDVGAGVGGSPCGTLLELVLARINSGNRLRTST